MLRENGAAPLAACFVDQSQSSGLPLLFASKPSFPASAVDIDGRSSMIPSPDPTVVLPGDAARLDDDNAPNNGIGIGGEAAETPRDPAAVGLDPLQLPPLPKVDGSPELPPQPRPGSERPPPSKQNTAYSPAWRNLVRQVGAAAATRPSLCACKKLAVAAMLTSGDDDGDDGGDGATQRSGRVCANRGKEVQQ